jgi:hypothetical protein
MKNALLLVVVLSLTVLGLSTCSSPSGGATVVSTWAGSYAGVGSGIISGWKFMSDNTTTGVWADSAGAVSISINANYVLNAGALSITATGTATSTVANPRTSPYTLSCTGTMASATGNGNYTISFSAWPAGYSGSGTWVVTRQ